MADQEAKPERGNALSRREALKCMTWAGTGVLWTLGGGVATSVLADSSHAPTRAAAGLSFIQISDSHIGFNKPANSDPLATLRETIARIHALPVAPSFVIHTGDVTHLAKPEQFDLAQSAFAEIGVPLHVIPGEHDMADGNDPRPFLQRFGGAGIKGDGWYSFDLSGAHFVALVNVVRLGDHGMGTLGADQLAWLRDDLSAHSSSTPIVVFSHFPLWGLYPEWGWGTQDGPAALALLKRFGSVTVLNGHIHQVQQQVEGNVVFHTARSTAYPQPAPGVGPGPGPLTLPAAQLRQAIGLTSVSVQHGRERLAIVDQALARS